MPVQPSHAVVIMMAILLHSSTAGQTMCTNCLNDSCKQGFHGDECNRTCRVQCVESRCHISYDTGSAVCDKGCIPGFRGRYCERKCPKRCAVCNNTMCPKCTSASWYGESCRKYCSHCPGASCYKNGTCKRGCTGRNERPGCNSQDMNENTTRDAVYDRDDDEGDKTFIMLIIFGSLIGVMLLVSCSVGVSLWQTKKGRKYRHNATIISPGNTNHVSPHHWDRTDPQSYLRATHDFPTEEAHIYEEIPSV
ncbi:multiple epidermal growth factor-like domains protein 6 [Haliotis rubra]|uniref:multiple epidermal growth factor-like domains protein 6 n=1 Tax=Haliotis rubra TaxID=36100 RepID=UPI001EE5E4E9|nr:multiple epidermal growth factor-like domains protein 6 [Haliotis rubra]